MTILRIPFFGLFLLALTGVHGQGKPGWNNRKCAVVLTYDDALDVDLDNAIPVLDSLGLKASFYLSGYSPGFSKRIADWKQVAAKGHELGNHTLFHPCDGSRPGREWVKPDYNLANYTVQRMIDEIRMTNTLLEVIDGKTQRTFAYPCGDTRILDSFYLDSRDFIAARGVKPEMRKIAGIDLYNVGCYGINGESGDELVSLVKKAMESGTLLVFLFHGVGGGHSLNVSMEAHRQLLHFLKENEKEIWIAPFIEVAGYVKEHEKKKNAPGQ